MDSSIRIFRKTGGAMRDVREVKAYEMIYAAELEFLDDCLWNGPNAAQWDGHFQASRPAASSERFPCAFAPNGAPSARASAIGFGREL